MYNRYSNTGTTGTVIQIQQVQKYRYSNSGTTGTVQQVQYNRYVIQIQQVQYNRVSRYSNTGTTGTVIHVQQGAGVCGLSMRSNLKTEITYYKIELIF